MSALALMAALVPMATGAAAAGADATTGVAQDYQFAVGHSGEQGRNQWSYLQWDITTQFRWLYRQQVTLNSAGFAKTVVDASAEYTNKQGENGWRYLQYDGVAYRDLQWNDTDERWHGDHTYTQFTSTGFHPDGGLDTVRAWTAPRAGTVRISAGINGGITVGNGPGAGGIKARIAAPSGQLWPATGHRTVAPGSTWQFAPIEVTVRAEAQGAVRRRPSSTRVMTPSASVWQPGWS